MSNEKDLNSYSEITAIKHDVTGKIFKNMDEYNVFIKRYLSEKQRIQREEDLRKDWRELIHSPRLNATSLDEYFNRISTLKTDLDSMNGVITSNFTILNHKFSTDIGYHVISGRFPINCSKNPNGTPVSTRYPGWEVEAMYNHDRSNIKMDTSQSSWKVLNPETKQWLDIPGLFVGSIGSVLGTTYRNKFYVYLQDLPLVNSRFYKELSKYDNLVGEYEQSCEKDHNRKLDKSQYIRTCPDTLEVRTKIEDTEMAILKYSESLSNLKQSLILYNSEAGEKFDKVEPYDYKRTSLLKTEITIKQKELEKLK